MCIDQYPTVPGIDYIDFLLYGINEYLMGIGHPKALIALPDDMKTTDFRRHKVVRSGVGSNGLALAVNSVPGIEQIHGQGL